MYITDLHIQNLKLLRDFKLSFGSTDEPRMWTVLIGENGSCKTSVLRAIACGAAGPTRANQLADVQSFPDLRRPSSKLFIQSWLNMTLESQPVYSEIGLDPGHSTLRGHSSAEIVEHDLESLASTNDPRWFVAGYGTSRVLSSAYERHGSRTSRDPGRDRLASLFDRSDILGTGFSSLLSDSAQFETLLQQALFHSDVLPAAITIELQGSNWAKDDLDAAGGDRFTLRQGGETVSVPATWLSQGYQSTIAWIADLIGQFMLQRKGDLLDLETLEGIVLIDEIDLHLHPKWQVDLIPQIKKIFPRLQFIVTTHSPLVLAGCRPEEIVVLKQDAEGNVYPEQPNDLPALLTASQIMSRFFEVDRSDVADLCADLRRYELLSAYDDAELDDEERAEKQQLAARLEEAEVLENA